MLTCTRLGCGKAFSEDSNNASSCLFHSGGPIFHEGAKSWSCCSDTNKPVTSFDDFMAIPGCTSGSHSTEQTAALAPVLSEQQQKMRDLGSNAPPPQPIPASRTATPALPDNVPPRPAHHDSLASGPIKEKDATPFPVAKEVEQDPDGATPDQGAKCKRLGCGKEAGESSERSAEECCFHPGVPIFHEGSKGYSCCKPRVLEFDQFLTLAGCSKNRHLFVGSSQKPEEELLALRTDHYQTPTQVIVSIFGKGADKEKSSISFDHWELEYDLHLPGGKRGRQKLALFGPINPSESSYRILGTKAEIVLSKLDGRSWPSLEYTGSASLTGQQLTFGVKR